MPTPPDTPAPLRPWGAAGPPYAGGARPEEQAPGKALGGYRPELDALRAGALLLVVAQHWWPRAGWGLDLGQIGVSFFFVLSGFLITSLLRQARDSASRRGVGKAVGNFLMRRALRLLPAYYVALALAAALNLSYVRAAWPWFVLHGSNIFFYRQQHWGEGTGHFWSLAVEEQFYLVWPLLVLRLRPRPLRVALAGLVLAGPLVRWCLVHATGTAFSLILVPAWLDLFAVGAGLSLWLAEKPWPRRGLLAGALGFGGYCGLAMSSFGTAYLVLGPTLLALASAAIIAAALGARLRPARAVLQAPILVGLGRVSYGLYLFHLFIPSILHRILSRLGQGVQGGAYYPALLRWETTPGALPAMALLLLALALLSWKLVEQPARRLQRYFPPS